MISAIRTTTDVANVERTRELLAEHRALPIWARLSRRLVGPYPSLKDLTELRRYDLGPVGRVTEDIDWAVTKTQWAGSILNLSMYPMPPRVSDFDPTISRRKASIILDFPDKEDDCITSIRQLTDQGVWAELRQERLPAGHVEGVGVYLPRTKHAPIIGGVALLHGNLRHPDVSCINLTDEAIQNLPTEPREELEYIINRVKGWAGLVEIMRGN